PFQVRVLGGGTTVLERYDFDLAKVIDDSPGPHNSYGSELRPPWQLEPLLRHHPSWQEFHDDMVYGIQYPFAEDIDEKTRLLGCSHPPKQRTGRAKALKLTKTHILNRDDSRNTSTRNENAPAPGEHGAGQPQIRLEERRAPARHEANTDRRQERLRGTHHSEGSQEIQGRGGAPGGPAAPEHDAWSSDQRGGGKLQGRQWDVACCMDRPRNGHEAAVQTDLYIFRPEREQLPTQRAGF
ncbi:hypothetical protein THAOC_10263, partial [Thalassiosira oceanica]